MSDSPFRVSGFGIVSAEICRRLAARGHELLMLGWFSEKASSYCGIQVDPFPVCPASSTARIAEYIVRFRPDYLVTLGDVPWIGYVAHEEFQEVLSRGAVKWCAYYPVDGVLADGRLPAQWVQVVLKADVAVTMSEFGVSASANSGIGATLIPLGCDTQLFRPAGKAEAKYRLGYEGKFVILADARNHRRKMLPRTLDIISRLEIPIKSLVFHLHTNREPQEDSESYQYDLQADIDLLKLGPVIRLSERELAPAGLAALYQAADVHLLTSFGEGFGLPTLQAASAGVVPIAPANSASAELTGRHGFAIGCDSSSIDEFGMVRYFIDRGQAAAVLQELYSNAALLRARSVAARAFAIAYDWELVAQRWDALFRRCEQDVYTSRQHLVAGPRASRLDANGNLAGSRHRPTGHSQSVLPVPRIGLPTRLRPPDLRSSDPLIWAEGSCTAQLRGLKLLFPRLRIEELTFSSSITCTRLAELVAAADLVVGTGEWLEKPLDLVCALGGVSFLGKSQLWPPVRLKNLVLQARLLLTDYAAAEQRLLIARERALKVTVEEWLAIPESMRDRFLPEQAERPAPGWRIRAETRR